MTLITIVHSHRTVLIPLIFHFRRKTRRHILVADVDRIDRRHAEELKSGIGKMRRMHQLPDVPIETVWVDGPLARAVRNGSICYLDEVVEARKDTTVVIHPLGDDRRVLPMEKVGELLEAPPEFCLTMSYNPGYQSMLKDLKQSTRQRFVALEFDYPDTVLEQKIVEKESGIDTSMARQLVKFAQMTRNLKGQGLDEGASTRLLVHAAKLMASDIAPVVACRSAIAQALTDDPDMLSAVNELSASLF